MRIIDADALIEKIKFRERGFVGYREIFNIEEMPTIDAVPVVRCKDCAHWKPCEVKGFEEHKYCEWAGWLVGENAYCSYGEVKPHD